MNFFLGSPCFFVSGIGDARSPRSTTIRPSAVICSLRPAMRKADGPMSTPRRLPPMSSGTPMRWTGRGTAVQYQKSREQRAKSPRTRVCSRLYARGSDMRIPDIKVPPPGPRARAILERDRAVVSPSYPRCAPFVMARGEGAVVEDVDGNVYLDCCAGIAVAATGHSHPEVVRAISEQAAKFVHISTDYYHELQVELGEKLAQIAPIGDRVKTFFSNSGSEAVEAAIKLARYHTKRFNIIAFLGSFHGRTLGSLALTSSRTVQRRGFGPMGAGVFHAPYANPYRCPVGGGRDASSCTHECLAYIENQILMHLVSPDEVSAIIVEPIQGEGGYVVPQIEFMQGLAAIAAKHGMLLIVDEVQSGIGRTGKMFAIEHAA